ncbi:MAG: 50S ribosomal protein L6 [Clostridia bacterium]|jgi:large subunit ribosomal protein L6|nr:50S ribosomal protein L6 [Clostridia bacterium]MDD3231855.1 50S ribosomal protein L6 [Clostridia bacterium]MDD3862494.1 50S ribosomal protein L6 [Clostridia bacterium]MDD4408458.1 50S ribosomal protein L6 [Clostridia bacterium]
MSRIGKKEIILPDGVTVSVSEDNIVSVNGTLGSLSQQIDKSISVVSEGNIIKLLRSGDSPTEKAKHGLYRSLIANMVDGVSKGFSKDLEIKGVGYKAQKQGNKLVLNLGFSHPVEVVEEDNIKLECPTVTQIKVSGIDKQKVGQVAAKIRSIRPVEPYHGYGVRYANEQVLRKVGKTAAKGKK